MAAWKGPAPGGRGAPEADASRPAPPSPGERRRWRGELGALACIAGFYALLHLAGVTCPIKLLTGISCPGCGMTRAWLAVLRLDWAAAWGYHPLFWLPAAALALYPLCRRYCPRLIRPGLWAVCGLFCLVYLFRLLLGLSPGVVVWEPREGLLYRLAAAAWAALK